MPTPPVGTASPVEQRRPPRGGEGTGPVEKLRHDDADARLDVERTVKLLAAHLLTYHCMLEVGVEAYPGGVPPVRLP